VNILKDALVLEFCFEASSFATCYQNYTEPDERGEKEINYKEKNLKAKSKILLCTTKESTRGTERSRHASKTEQCTVGIKSSAV